MDVADKEHTVFSRVKGVATKKKGDARGKAELKAKAWYDGYGKTWYADAKTSLLICKRYEEMCTETDKLLTHYLRQAHYMWCQQEHIANMTQWFSDNCKRKTTQYWNTTRQARETIYLIRKRPRKQWDPTLWEVLLQPLPKRHKTHWDPNEWEIPLT